MGKHKTRGEIRQESGSPVIGATFDAITARKIARFVSGLQDVAPGLVESVNRQPIVRVMSAKTVSRQLRGSDFSVPYSTKLPVSGLGINESGELIISMRDNDSMIRLARCAALGAMQEINGTKHVKTTDLSEYTEGQITPEATIALVNTRNLGEYQELFTDNPVDAISSLAWERSDSAYKLKGPRLPALLGIESLVLTRLKSHPSMPKDMSPATRAPSMQFNRHLYIEAHDPSGMGLAG
jgi:hypothetical protein